jgi:hypothetical protein
VNPDRDRVHAKELRPNDELNEFETHDGIETVRHVVRAGRWPWSPYLVETNTGHEIDLRPWEKVSVARRPDSAGPDDVRIEYRCTCGKSWSEWSPSSPDTVFQRNCPQCGTNCYGG